MSRSNRKPAVQSQPMTSDSSTDEEEMRFWLEQFKEDQEQLEESREVRLLKEYFFCRTDVVACARPFLGAKPCPSRARDTIERLLACHVFGKAAQPSRVQRCPKRVADLPSRRGYYRVGSYCLSPTSSVWWMCLDVDGDNHSGKSTESATHLVIDLAIRLQQHGFSPYLEKSGSARGWHLWIFFDCPIEAIYANAIGLRLARNNSSVEVFPKQTMLSEGGVGNPVWLPWWSGANPGGNQFYRPRSNGGLRIYEPKVFERVGRDAVIDALSRTGSVPVLETRIARRAKGEEFILSAAQQRDINSIPGICQKTRRFLAGEYANGPEWHNRLFAAACDLHGCNIDQDQATKLLLTGASPWDEVELSRASATIDSAFSEDRLPASAFAASSNVRRPRTHHFEFSLPKRKADDE